MCAVCCRDDTLSGKVQKGMRKQELENLKFRSFNFRVILWKKKMNEKGTQVAIGLKRFKKTSTGTQTPSVGECDKETQCGISQGSYGRERVHQTWRYHDLMVKLEEKENLMTWLMNEGLLAKDSICSVCEDQMNLLNAMTDLMGLNGNAEGR